MFPFDDVIMISIDATKEDRKQMSKAMMDTRN